jgi:hypothetical protein
VFCCGRMGDGIDRHRARAAAAGQLPRVPAGARVGVARASEHCRDQQCPALAPPNASPDLGAQFRPRGSAASARSRAREPDCSGCAHRRRHRRERAQSASCIFVRIILCDALHHAYMRAWTACIRAGVPIANAMNAPHTKPRLPPGVRVAHNEAQSG